MSVWAENSVGLVTEAMTGAVIIDQTIPQAGSVVCPEYIQVYIDYSLGNRNNKSGSKQ